MKQYFMICRTIEMVQSNIFIDPVVGYSGGDFYSKQSLIPIKRYKTLKGAESWMNKTKNKDFYIVIPFYSF